MGLPKEHSQTALMTAVFSRHRGAISWALSRMSALWGPIQMTSDDIAFQETNYYAASMGDKLHLRLVLFASFINPEALIEIKMRTNQLELELATAGTYTESRPVNIDPGYLTLAKLVLATTKDAGHRLYLGRGIYGEVALTFTNGQWQDCAWTYPNYRRREYKEFLCLCRQYLHSPRQNQSQSQQ